MICSVCSAVKWIYPTIHFCRTTVDITCSIRKTATIRSATRDCLFSSNQIWIDFFRFSEQRHRFFSGFVAFQLVISFTFFTDLNQQCVVSVESKPLKCQMQNGVVSKSLLNVNGTKILSSECKVVTGQKKTLRKYLLKKNKKNLHPKILHLSWIVAVVVRIFNRRSVQTSK